MSEATNTFSTLAHQAGRGDVDARKQMERDLYSIVRRVIQNGAGTSRLDRRILDEARRWEVSTRANQDHLIGHVVRSLCSSVIAQVRPKANGERSTAETVLSFSNPGRCGSA